MADRQKLAFYLSQNYTIELKPYGDGSYFARVQELPGCIAEVENLQEAMANIEGSKEVWLEHALEKGEEIPLPAE